MPTPPVNSRSSLEVGNNIEIRQVKPHEKPAQVTLSSIIFGAGQHLHHYRFGSRQMPSGRN